MSENTPKAKKIPKELTIHDHTRIDDYYWLNDRENPQVVDYLNQENSYTDNALEHTQDLQQKLYDEIIGRIKQQDESVPYYANEYYYYVKFFEGKEYPVYCRKHLNLENEEQVILDVNVLAEGHSYYQVKGLNVSQDNTLVAFGVDTNGRRQYKLYIKNLLNNEITDCEIENTVGGVAWTNDNAVFFYAEKDPQSLRPNRILRYSLKTKEREVVYTEDDNTFITFVYKTKSRKYIMIGCYSTVSTEYRFVDADNYHEDFRIIEPRKRDLEYSVDHFAEKFYIVTNDQAKNFKLVETSIHNTSRENWKDVIAHRSDVLIEAIEIFKDFLVVEERQKGLPQLRIIKWDDKSEHYLDFGEPAYMAYISVNREFDTSLLRYGYTSLTTPNSTFDYNMNTKEKTLLKQQTVLGDFSSDRYQSERIEATAQDGVKVPISLVYRKDKKNDAGNPLLLYAYGSYGHSIDPSFSSARLSLLDRGFIFAIAHIRGGQEMGRGWYEDGKLFNKKNTFSDFIACSEHVIEKGYTTKDLLFAEGGSAGGLLMGAVINMSENLYRGVIAAVPFVDVVTTMLDDSIPLTTGEYDEWGNPNVKEYYEYMLSYSPYDNVTAKDYPNMLVTTGLHDSQVQYWEPAKWVAKLRDIKTDNNLLLLHTDMDSGHGGASGRFKRHKLTALEYAFLFHLLGIKE
ncbi:S9 family peptidase [Candidatus Uabimicrobium amorphum]|uniref:Oligopeptidase B n=1 Tax=Uabimicrobium amorphum TaxID=2596890 RepID=A0A5S9IJ85_UABAM|nr:S9 family peptidase [Candidatus Uabimicrobium amorphum]BBM82391.1 oligopeptidase B [Candidatus Uabimicrobium amorphum]